MLIPEVAGLHVNGCIATSMESSTIVLVRAAAGAAAGASRVSLSGSAHAHAAAVMRTLESILYYGSTPREGARERHGMRGERGAAPRQHRHGRASPLGFASGACWLLPAQL